MGGQAKTKQKIEQIAEMVSSWRQIRISQSVMEKITITVPKITIEKDVPQVKHVKTSLGDGLEILYQSIRTIQNKLDKILQKAGREKVALDNTFVAILSLIETTLNIRKWITIGRKATIILSYIEDEIGRLSALGADWTQTDELERIRRKILFSLSETQSPEQLEDLLVRMENEARSIATSILSEVTSKRKDKLGELLMMIENARRRGEREVPAHELKDEEIAMLLESYPNIRFNPLRRVFLLE